MYRPYGATLKNKEKNTITAINDHKIRKSLKCSSIYIRRAYQDIDESGIKFRLQILSLEQEKLQQDMILKVQILQ